MPSEIRTVLSGPHLLELVREDTPNAFLSLTVRNGIDGGAATVSLNGGALKRFLTELHEHFKDMRDKRVFPPPEIVVTKRQRAAQTPTRAPGTPRGRTEPK